MAHQKHKTPVPRILDIVRRLYALEKLRSTDLAAGYGNSRRTIHRDMLLIAQTLPLKNEAGVWELDTIKHHSRFQQTLLQAFARNIEIEAECLERINITRELVSFAIEYKRLPKKLGESLSQVISDAEKCRFEYVKPERTTTRTVDPIKIYTENGRWYVIARDYSDNKVKYFNLEKIKNFISLKDERQTLTPQMIAEADAMKSIWSSAGAQEVTVKLYVRPEIATYIRDIKLHKSQIIYDEHYDGGMEVHCTITHKLEILPQIKYWLPRVHILEPKWLWEELKKDLEIYQHEDQKMQGG